MLINGKRIHDLSSIGEIEEEAMVIQENAGLSSNVLDWDNKAFLDHLELNAPDEFLKLDRLKEIHQTKSNNRNLDKLFLRKEKELGIKVIENSVDSKNNLHVLCKREFDDSYIVWTSPVDENGVNQDFYNGKYDMDLSKEHSTITSYSLTYLLAYSGLRIGEALGLKWENIDFEECIITVERTRDYYGARGPKTKKIRFIGVDEVVIKQLKVYQKWCIKTKFRYGMRLDKKNDFIFITYQGGQPCTISILFYVFESLYKVMEKDKIIMNRITPPWT